MIFLKKKDAIDNFYMSAGDLLTNMSKYKPNKENIAPFDYTKKQKQKK